MGQHQDNSHGNVTHNFQFITFKNGADFRGELRFKPAWCKTESDEIKSSSWVVSSCWGGGGGEGERKKSHEQEEFRKTMEREKCQRKVCLRKFDVVDH